MEHDAIHFKAWGLEMCQVQGKFFKWSPKGLQWMQFTWAQFHFIKCGVIDYQVKEGWVAHYVKHHKNTILYVERCGASDLLIEAICLVVQAEIPLNSLCFAEADSFLIGMKIRIIMCPLQKLCRVIQHKQSAVAIKWWYFKFIYQIIR